MHFKIISNPSHPHVGVHIRNVHKLIISIHTLEKITLDEKNQNNFSNISWYGNIKILCAKIGSVTLVTLVTRVTRVTLAAVIGRS